MARQRHSQIAVEKLARTLDLLALLADPDGSEGNAVEAAVALLPERLREEAEDSLLSAEERRQLEPDGDPGLAARLLVHAAARGLGPIIPESAQAAARVRANLAPLLGEDSPLDPDRRPLLGRCLTAEEEGRQWLHRDRELNPRERDERLNRLLKDVLRNIARKTFTAALIPVLAHRCLRAASGGETPSPAPSADLASAEEAGPQQEAASGGGPTRAGDLVLYPLDALTDHPLLAPIPPMSPAEWESFLESVKRDSVLVPVMVQEGGTLLDGRSRVTAAREKG